jgi:probable F420-dependent oxidoreductase
MNASASVSPAQAPELAAGLEDAGCGGLFFAEVNHDPFLCVAAAAGRSRRLRLGTSIALALTRGPTPLSYIAHDLAELTDGRLVLGLGSQVRAHITRRFSMTWSDPVRRMRELVEAFRLVWRSWESGEKCLFTGEFYSISLMPGEFRPAAIGRPSPPVYLAAVGPAMARMAGEIADGVFIHAFSTPEYVRSVILPAVREGLRRAGRATDSFSMCYSPFTALADDAGSRAEARQRMRQILAFYGSTPAYRRVLDLHGFGDLQPRLNALAREDRRREMADLVPDEIVSLFTTVGPPDDVAEGLRRRWGGLADELMVPSEFWLGPAGPAWSRAARAPAGE